MVAVARESPAKNFGQDGSTTLHGMFIALDYQCGSTTTGHQSVAVTVERATGFRGIVETGRESLQGIKRGNAVHVVLLCTTTDNTVLQTILDKQVAQSQRLRTTGTGSRGRQVDTLQMEQRSQVHRHRRVHRLEDSSRTTGCGQSCLAELVHCHHSCLSHRIVTIDDTHLVTVNIILCQLGLLQRLDSSHIGILCLLWHHLAHVAAQHFLQVRLWHITTNG